MSEFFTLNSEPTAVVDDTTVEHADFDLILGTSGPDDPVVAYCDRQQLISSEQYTIYGRWRGWKHEIIEDRREYFKRKLMGE